MRLNDVIQTPDGPATIVGFPMLRNFRIGVRYRLATGEKKNQVRCIIERWQRELSNEPL